MGTEKRPNLTGAIGARLGGRPDAKVRPTREEARKITARELEPGDVLVRATQQFVVAAVHREAKEAGGRAIVFAVDGRSMSVLRKAYLFRFDPDSPVNIGPTKAPVTAEAYDVGKDSTVNGLAFLPAVTPNLPVLRQQNRPAEYLREDARRTTADDPDRALWYSPRCGYWTDDWGKPAKAGNIPVCPSCGAPGMITTIRKWNANIRKHTAEVDPGYQPQEKETCSPPPPQEKADAPDPGRGTEAARGEAGGGGAGEETGGAGRGAGAGGGGDATPGEGGPRPEGGSDAPA
jgi:hypothetical protein